MKAFKSAIVLGAIVATVAVSACRREEYYHEPMKLGAADMPVTQQVAR